MKGRLILLTDNLCFSSCLVVTDDFRTLGAFHIGQTTDAATHFNEVREQYLPSGYSLFSTLQFVRIFSVDASFLKPVQAIRLFDLCKTNDLLRQNEPVKMERGRVKELGKEKGR
jgi:hypothetical protein